MMFNIEQYEYIKNTEDGLGIKVSGQIHSTIGMIQGEGGPWI
jgi:hypothetical protein